MHIPITLLYEKTRTFQYALFSDTFERIVHSKQEKTTTNKEKH